MTQIPNTDNIYFEMYIGSPSNVILRLIYNDVVDSKHCCGSQKRAWLCMSSISS